MEKRLPDNFVLADEILRKRIFLLLQENRLPVEDLDNSKPLFALIRDKEILAAGGLEEFGDCALLRSVVVPDAHKGKGFGKAITSCLEIYASLKNIASLFLLTTTAKDFFQNNGYRLADRDDLPTAVKTSSEFTTMCPSTAFVMQKELR